MDKGQNDRVMVAIIEGLNVMVISLAVLLLIGLINFISEQTNEIQQLKEVRIEKK
jgi:hypothetical protein